MNDPLSGTPPTLIKTTGKPGASESKNRALYHCSYCHRDISSCVRIRCAECTDVDFCVDCFSVGVEPHPHKVTHAFRVIDRTMSCPLFSPHWGADEELLLLEGLEMFGVANWNAVSEHVGSKSPDECRDHYFEVYLDHPSAPLPRVLPSMQGVDLTSPVRPMDMHAHHGDFFEHATEQGPPPQGREGSPTAPPQGAAGPGPSSTQAAALPPSKGAGRGRRTDRFAGIPGAPSAAGAGAGAQGEDTQAQGEEEGGRTGAKGARQGGKGTGTGAGVPGASPRQEVGGKHPPGGAPTGLTLRLPTSAALQANEVGAPGAAVNTVEITGYHGKREEFEPEWDNDAEVPIAELDFRLPGGGAEEELPLEVELKQRLVQIYNARLDERERRRAFLVERGLLNVKKMQAQERRRPPEELLALAQLRPLARFTPSAQDFEALCEGLLVEAQLRQRIEELQEFRALGLRTLQEAEAYAMERQRRAGGAGAGGAPQPVLGAAAGVGMVSGRARVTGSAVLEDLDAMRGVPLAPPEAGKGTREARKLLASAMEAHDCAPRPPAVTNWRLEVGAGTSNLVAQDLVGASLLTPAELTACSTLRLTPPQVAQLRSVLEHEARAKGRIAKTDMSTLLRIDRARATKLNEILHEELMQGHTTGPE